MFNMHVDNEYALYCRIWLNVNVIANFLDGGVNGVSESLESTVLSEDRHDLDQTTTPEPQLIPDHKVLVLFIYIFRTNTSSFFDAVVCNIFKCIFISIAE